MENGCPFGDRDARKVHLLKGGGRNCRNFGPEGDLVRSDSTRFAQPSVGFDVRELQSEERQCQLVKLGFQKLAQLRPCLRREHPFVHIWKVPLPAFTARHRAASSRRRPGEVRGGWMLPRRAK